MHCHVVTLITTQEETNVEQGSPVEPGEEIV